MCPFSLIFGHLAPQSLATTKEYCPRDPENYAKRGNHHNHYQISMTGFLGFCSQIKHCLFPD